LDNKEIYHIGASLKDLGKKTFAFSKMEDLAHHLYWSTFKSLYIRDSESSLE